MEAEILGLRSGAAARYGKTREPPALPRFFTFVLSLFCVMAGAKPSTPICFLSAVVAEAKPRTSFAAVFIHFSVFGVARF